MKRVYRLQAKNHSWKPRLTTGVYIGTDVNIVELSRTTRHPVTKRFILANDQPEPCDEFGAGWQLHPDTQAPMRSYKFGFADLEMLLRWFPSVLRCSDETKQKLELVVLDVAEFVHESANQIVFDTAKAYDIVDTLEIDDIKDML